MKTDFTSAAAIIVIALALIFLNGADSIGTIFNTFHLSNIEQTLSIDDSSKEMLHKYTAKERVWEEKHGETFLQDLGL